MTKIPVVNGLRGLAICGVVFHHLFFGLFLYGQHEPSFFLQTIKAVLSSGWLGVNLFFMLSGLVLYWPYACGKRSFSHISDIGQFYKKRFVRLFPLYWFVCIVSMVFAADIAISEPSFLRWFAALMAVTFPFSAGSFVPRPNWVLWSLGVEILFSVLFPFVVLLIHRFGWRRMLSCVFVLSFITRVLGQLVYGGAQNGYLLNALSDSVLGRLDEFLLGMLVAHLLVAPGKQAVFSRNRTLFGMLAIMFTMYAWGCWLRLEVPGWSAAMFSWALDIGMFFVVGYLSSASQSSRLRQFFEIWSLQMFGLMCYSIYLWHGIVMIRLSVVGKGITEHFIYFAIVILLSCFTYRYIEFGAEREFSKLMPVRRIRTQLSDA